MSPDDYSGMEMTTMGSSEDQEEDNPFVDEFPGQQSVRVRVKLRK